MTERILVVDDQAPNIRLLEAVLTPHGYTILTASSGEEALRNVTDEPPDIVLLDVVMPGMSGFDVCRKLRADERTRFLPVVMITASPEQDRVEAIEAGADDFVTKPFDKHELLARVRSLLRIKAYHDTIERQRAELSEWNRTLERRVNAQGEEIVALRRLRRFLSPPIAGLIVNEASPMLDPHPREISGGVCDLRGFTAVSRTAGPGEGVRVLRAYHPPLG